MGGMKTLMVTTMSIRAIRQLGEEAELNNEAGVGGEGEHLGI